MIKRNGYLVEEYAGELDSMRRVKSGIEETHIKDLETQGFSDIEIKKLIIEAE